MQKNKSYSWMFSIRSATWKRRHIVHSSVGTVTRLRNGRSGDRIPSGAKIFLFSRNLHLNRLNRHRRFFSRGQCDRGVKLSPSAQWRHTFTPHACLHGVHKDNYALFLHIQYRTMQVVSHTIQTTLTFKRRIKSHLPFAGIIRS
jgi:hypothetical protein